MAGKSRLLVAKRAEPTFLSVNKMLPKNKRVNKETFQLLIKTGKTLSTGLFLFYFKPQKESQYVFVAPKAIFKKAVLRNKFRRLGYNVLNSLPLSGGQGIFMFKKSAKEATKDQIDNEIKLILNKAYEKNRFIPN